MKRTFLLIYTTTSGQTFKEFKSFDYGKDKETCHQSLIDEFDELAYLYLNTGNSVHYINVDHIESLEITEVTDGQTIAYGFEDYE
ncbi:hypothetical protein [Staphylococcus lugdunensis]|uniref:hypothetical protein n=1 Tax=Staphylococcus lugdunensis TaxID=28035 RepID=UPI000A10A712|nr:hypothetical protein [Staphylococcus lugdunensis]ARJ28282.1 hypothetical protein B7469_11445 [Staphylococcus lugdunensis]MCH8673332.1 hypothetical protein [Staphylococcus lugdunensis]MCH8675574.1 hypothetical protein [Staphylococcus lugdunensis]MCI2752686.1 hypothetical protein [Staphylococcus lugdunensis]MCI2762579.1 hypothetical protein [Staphylococcus lugdunensis]